MRSAPVDENHRGNIMKKFINLSSLFFSTLKILAISYEQNVNKSLTYS